MSSFADLKKSRSASMQKLVEAAAKMNERSFESRDEGEYWTPTRDKAGNGYAVIRLLPAAKGDDVPWVRFWDHGFKGPTGKWYIEKSRTSINEPDPLADLNSKLWNTGIEADKATARSQKRRLHHVANILVITDSANPANDGKCFRWKFGKKLFEKIMDATNPKFADEKPVNPFDLWEGANFKLKIQTVEGFPNYDKSSFAEPTALYNGDEAKLEKLYESLKSLKDLTDPTKYKSYDELLKKLKFVLGEDEVNAVLGTKAPTAVASAPVTRSAPAPVKDEDEDDVPFTAPAKAPAKAAPVVESSSDDDDDDAFFAKLAR